MSVSFLSIQGVARDSPAPQLAPPLTRGVARRAELTSAQKASEHLAKGGGGGREIAQLREQLAEAREEGAMAKVQVARALTLAFSSCCPARTAWIRVAARRIGLAQSGRFSFTRDRSRSSARRFVRRRFRCSRFSIARGTACAACYSACVMHELRVARALSLIAPSDAVDVAVPACTVRIRLGGVGCGSCCRTCTLR